MPEISAVRMRSTGTFCEAAADLDAHLVHQLGVELVVEQAVNFENAGPEVTPLGLNAVLQR